MKRRTLLATLAGGTLGGCVSRSPASGTPDRTTTHGTRTSDPPTTDPPDRTDDPGTPGSTTSDSDSTTDDGTGWGPGTGDPFETITVGSRDDVWFADNNRAHTVRVWNGLGDPRSIAFVLDRGGETALERTLQFPADGWIELTLAEPTAYELTVRVEGESPETVSVPRTQFDCNSSWTNVAVDAEGAVDSTTATTDLACPGPAVADTSFSHEDGKCGQGGSAAVAFREGAVHVSGTITASTPCHDLSMDAQLQNAEEYEDGTDDVLVVRVTTSEQPGGCATCLAAIPYGATVGFDHDYPSNVRVVHDGAGDPETVQEASP